MLVKFTDKGPTAAAVAVRAQILREVALKASLSVPPDQLVAFRAKWSRADWQQFEASLKRDGAQRLRALGRHRAQLTAFERAILATPETQWSAQQLIDALWCIESFQVLLWALGFKAALPPYGEVAPRDCLRDYPPRDFEGYLQRAELRSRGAIEAMQAGAELWLWRSRLRDGAASDRRQPASPEGDAPATLDEIIRLTAERAHGRGDLSAPVAGDFPVAGRAYRALSDEEHATVRSITLERLRALNWLCGLAPKNQWDATPTNL